MIKCQKAGCDCEKFEQSRILNPKFVGVCVQCRHGHTDEHDVMHQKAAATDSVPCAVTDSLFVSNIVAATNAELLRKHGITHIVNCCPGAFRGNGGALVCRILGAEDGFERLDLDGFEDSSGQDIAQFGQQATQFISDALAANAANKVLVHCAQGVSRSSSMCILFLMEANQLAYDDALALVKQARPLCQPNTSFEEQLKEIDRAMQRERKQQQETN